MKTLSVNNLKTVLSTSGVYKTGRFVKETAAFFDIDGFLNKLAECLFLNKNEIAGGGNFRLEIGDDLFFFVTQKFPVSDIRLNKSDIVFYKYFGLDPFVRRGDRRFFDLLKSDSFLIKLNAVNPSAASENSANNDASNPKDFLKLYRLTGFDGANFPLLNQTQHQIVVTEDKNMLVQGVAGSGKTNLCIDKIVFSASRAYAGRVLYSTFSRGLLADTKAKVAGLISGIKRLINDLENDNVIFADADRVKSVENRLGIYLPAGEEKIIAKLRDIAVFLESKVDYYLIEDLYRARASDTSEFINTEVAGEEYFLKKYIGQIRNHNLSARLQKISYLSHEVIYKEIYGMIGGCCDPLDPQKTLSLNDYIDRRKDSFSRPECETIYALAADYRENLDKTELVDNNIMCRAMLKEEKTPAYSLVILDEVQDMTEVNLVFFKSLCRRMFCAGDALQMINASYFSFAYLKRLLYEKDISFVAELTNNYRNDKKIADIAEALGTLNNKCFGVHSFVLRADSLDASQGAAAVFVRGTGFLDALNKQPYNNYTVVVSGQREKERLRHRLKKQEILTVAEIKGLERDTVILYDLLSANSNQWRAFERLTVNRKTADENSVYRYYFNLLYVGVSRAKTQLYVLESENLPSFNEFFKDNFDALTDSAALERLLLDADKTEAEQDEILERVKAFVKQEQYGNARFATQGILSDVERAAELNRIDVAESYIRRGNHREAGIRFLQLSMYSDARLQFVLCGDETLVKLAEICDGANHGLGLEVLDAFADIDNPAARKVILGLVEDDLRELREGTINISKGLSKIKTKNLCS